MSYVFGLASTKQRSTLHPHLQAILVRTLATDDFVILEGARDYARQAAAFAAGTSKIDPAKGPWPHMIRKDGYAWAADLHPYINGKPLDTTSFGPAQQAQFAWFLRRVKEVGIAYFHTRELPYHLRFGVDWDEDNVILTDQTFQDWFHVEMVRN